MERPRRRRFLQVATAGLTVGLAGCGGADTDATETDGQGTTTTDPPGPTDPPDTTTGTPNEGGTATATETATETEPTATPVGTPTVDSVGLEAVASGFEGPLDVEFAPDADRRYVVDQTGLIYVHEADGVLDEPFLDVRESVIGGYETGLLGLALHPEFSENRRAFVRYSAPPREGTPSDYSHTFVLAEFEATDDGRRLDPASERSVLEIPEPQANHNAGDIAFGPDGYLYVAVGDGGGRGDRGMGHVEDWYDPVEGGNGQDVTENLLGSILRIDVNDREGDKGYAIPDDNPLVGEDGLDEHYAWGFRNPWRMSFDEGTLVVGDVGQSSWEEVSVVERGGNYGWNVKEGSHCYLAGDCPDGTPEDVRGGEPLIDPVVEYPREGQGVSGISVIGGYVYRGDSIPELDGQYVFGDLRPNGRLFVANPEGRTWPTRTVEIAENAGRLEQILSFGRDPDGEVYVLGTGANDGWLHRLVPAE